jgi:hypothetical protein
MRARIINLGDIVTPNIMKTPGALTTLFASKNPSSNPADIGKAIVGVMHENMNLIKDFKLGKIPESEFNERMISALEKANDAKLSIDEFNTAWNAMHPTFNQYEALLNEAIAYNNQPGQQIIFISFTNPKDIRYLTEQLKINGIPHKTDGEQLTEIAGIRLLTTYAAQKEKAELIVTAIKELRSNQIARGTLAASMNSMFNNNNDEPRELPDIKYIRAVNDIKDPVLKEDLDKTTQEVEKQASSLAIETIIWKKFEKQMLSEVLKNSHIASRIISASML